MKNGFYLPEYKLTPQAIFQDEILAFDVDFFNPKENRETTSGKDMVIEKINSTGEEVLYNGYDEETKNDHSETGGKCEATTFGNEIYTSTDENDNFEEDVNKHTYHFHHGSYVTREYISLKCDFGEETTYRFKAIVLRRYYGGKRTMNDEGFDITQHIDIRIDYEFYKLVGEGNERQDIDPYGQMDHWTYSSSSHDHYAQNLGKQVETTPENIFEDLLAGEGVSLTYEERIVERSTARELQPIVSAWYVTFRNIALVALLSVLVYIGIRITLSSVATDKAKYKQMLIDWTVALCLVFLMHYIMSFSVTINKKIIDAISSITTSNLDEERVLGEAKRQYEETTNAVEDGESIDSIKDKFDVGVQLFIINEKTAVDNAYNTLVGSEDDEVKKSGKYSNYYKYFSKDKNILFWPASDFMAQARLLGQDMGEEGSSETQTSVARAGYNIIYVVLVIYTIIFCFTYLKRVIYMAFLTIIAPLVAITYPIDKLNDGQAQAFNLWLKEYIFNLLIQPMHLMLYTILVGSAMEFAANNIFYVVVALGFLTPAEKLLRRFFGFEKAQTPGAFGGAAGAALMMTGLSKLMQPKSSKGSLGAGDKDNKNDEENTKISAWKDKDNEATDNLVGIGGQNEFRDNLNEEEQGRFDLARTGRQEALAGANEAVTDEERQEYNNLANSYNQDLNEFRNPNWLSNGNVQVGNVRRSGNNSQNTNTPKRKRSVIRGIRRGTRSYLEGMGNKMKAKHKANGGFVRRGVRMAAGIKTAALGASAAGLIGITTGDPSKAAQYMATAGAGGYALGKGVANNAADYLKVEGITEEPKKGYYADDYKDHVKQKQKKEYMKNEENIRRIEEKLKVERKEAKKIMEQDLSYYYDKDIDNIDDMIAAYRLEKEENMTKEQAYSVAEYANLVMNGEDTRTMTAKRKKEYKDTFIPKFQQNGSTNASGDVDVLFDKLDKFHGYKK